MLRPFEGGAHSRKSKIAKARASEREFWAAFTDGQANAMARPLTGNNTMTFEDWRPLVSAYLDGKTNVMTMDVVRGALGRTYGQMSRDDWGVLAGIIKSLGWTRRKLGKGVFCWEGQIQGDEVRGVIGTAPPTLAKASAPIANGTPIINMGFDQIQGDEPIDLPRPPISFRPARKPEPGEILYRGMGYPSRKALARHLAPELGRTIAAVVSALKRRGDDAEAVVRRY